MLSPDSAVPVDAHTQVVALLGYPVEHSLSPLLHNTAFAHQGLNFVYVARAVRPADLEAAVAGLRALRFAGANVTTPHKQAVLPYLDGLSEQARAVGAVNTIVARMGGDDQPVRLYGDNTDVAGFLDPLLPLAGRLEGAPMLILGAGGAARAVAYALLGAFRPERLAIAARTPEKAERLARDLAPFDKHGVMAVQTFDAARETLRASLLVVNTTPLGMHPHVDATPWEQGTDFSPDQVVYDLIYNPGETRLMRDASGRGATVIGGMAMLIDQAATAYAQWTGVPMPAEIVRQAVTARERDKG